MRLASIAWTVCVCLAATLCTTPAAASGDNVRMLSYLQNATRDDAADYLAILIRSFGCEVRREDRTTFSANALAHLAFDFGVAESAGDNVAIREALFSFSFRAGPRLVERGELIIDRDGTARLVTCNALIS